jgi:UDP-glucose 4-epimerase
MRIRSALVTGATGFLGKEVVALLKGGGCKVYRGVRGDVESPNDVFLDLESLDLQDRLNSLPEVDAVIHLGCKVGFGIKQKSDLFRANVLATGAIASLAYERGIPLVFSSAAIIAGCQTGKILQDSLPMLDNPYAESKFLGEELVQASRAKSSILRIGGVFGLGGPNHLALNRAIASAREGSLPAVVGNGSALRNYIYAKDAAAVIAFVLERGITGTHLVAGTHTHSIQEMLEIICEVFLPGERPSRVEGSPAKDQLIETSSVLPPTRSFRAAVEDMRNDALGLSRH